MQGTFEAESINATGKTCLYNALERLYFKQENNKPLLRAVVYARWLGHDLQYKTKQEPKISNKKLLNHLRRLKQKKDRLVKERA